MAKAILDKFKSNISVFCEIMLIEVVLRSCFLYISTHVGEGLIPHSCAQFITMFPSLLQVNAVQLITKSKMIYKLFFTKYRRG